MASQNNKKTCSKPNPTDFFVITKCASHQKNKTYKKAIKKNERSLIIRSKPSSFVKKKIVTTNSLEGSSKVDVNRVYTDFSNSISKSVVLISNTLSQNEIDNSETFATVDVIPTFKKCNKHTNTKRLTCFKRKLLKHINTKLIYPKKAKKKGIKGKVWVVFVIDSDGRIANIETHGPRNTELLTEEAARVASELPFLIPGKKNGKNVNVKYSFPIKFSLNQ